MGPFRECQNASRSPPKKVLYLREGHLQKGQKKTHSVEKQEFHSHWKKYIPSNQLF